MRATPFLAVIALLAGCASEADRIAEKQREAEELIRVYGPACTRLGFVPNTDQWRDCVLRLSTRDSLIYYPARIYY